uniref:Possible chloride channel n=1 Tax=uncultured marine type-A Synechococcus GOM 5D20 TaxID=364154 RepID=Q0QK78_9SYNE|nr:possible chloride channel [uncultured marine type-A Synechococcus GOM 5D20]
MNQLRLSALALLTGAISGAGVALFIGLIGVITRQLWGDPVVEGFERQIPLVWSLAVCGGIGLVLSQLHRAGEHTMLSELPDTVAELRDPSHAPKRNKGRAILGAALAQVGGGCIGPEALMTHLAAMISQRIWRSQDLDLKLAATAGSLGLFGFPLLGGAVVQSGKHRDLIARWIPGALGGLAGFAAFHGIDQASGGSLQRMPYRWPSNLGDDLGTLSSGAIAGLVGWGLGWLLLRWRSWLALQHLLAHWRWWPVLTGLLLGLTMHWLPLVPFAGEEQLRPLLEGANRTGPSVLMISAIIKLLLLGLCLETGWRGGMFFPLFVIACSVGVGLNELSPGLGSLGSWCGGITGAIYLTVLRSPLLALILGLGLLQGHGATAVLVGVAVAWVITDRSQPGDAPPPVPQTPDSP